MRPVLRTLGLVGAGAAALLLVASSRPAESRPGTADGNTRVHYDRERGVVEFLVGPVRLPAMPHEGGQGGHDGALLPPIARVEMPADVAIYGVEYDLVDARGRLLPSDLLHHVNLIDPTTRELFLPISRRVAAAGRETGTARAPWLLFGYQVRAGAPVVVAAMLHNETGRDYDDVTLRFRLLAVPPRRPWPLLSVYPFQMDVLFPHGDKSFDLPPGRSVRSYEASPAIAGRIVAMGGHAHDYATRIAFEDVTTGQVVWEAAPNLGPDGGIRSVPIGMLWRRLGARLSPDRVYRVTVEYDNPTSDTIPQGGMGVVAGLFLPSAPWPAADTTDATYRADRAHYLRLAKAAGPADTAHPVEHAH
jgi:hypothetical protein